MKKEFTCDICQKTCSSRAILSYHKLSIHGGERTRLKCDLCKKTFTSRKSLLSHLETHQNIKYKCNICGIERNYKNSLEKHINDQHNGTKTRNTTEPKFQCNGCERKFKSLGALNKHTKHIHEKAIHEENQTKCKMCNKNYKVRASLLRHIRMIHENQRSSYYLTSKDKIKCQYCDQKINKSNMVSHIKVSHTKENNCQSCQKSFRSKGALGKHMQMCLTGNKPKCSLCNKAFSCEETLIRHIKMKHENEFPSWYSKGSKKIKCQYCEKEISGWYFPTHINMHQKDLNEKDCEFCVRSFQSIESLRNHVKVNHGEKSKCVYCGKLYLHRDSLFSHIKEYHIKDPNERHCELCKKSFPSQKFLSDHVQNFHQGVKPNKCKQCPKSYFHNETLKAHIVKKHLQKELMGNANEIVCSLCNKMFSSKLDFENHFSKLHE